MATRIRAMRNDSTLLMAADKAKIFGIGLSKTGTTSLANALQILGFKTKDNMGVVKYAIGDLASVDLDVVDANDALTDTPIPSFYRELDRRYPGSKFILTVRDPESWLKSCKKQFSQRFAQIQTDAHKQLFIDLYGTDVFEEDRFARGYARFVDGVHDYFKDRPRDLLVINVAAGEGWEKLSPFLERPVPDVPFPKANVTQVRWMRVDDIVAIATQAGEALMRRYEGKRHVASDKNGYRRPRTAAQFFEQAVQRLRGEDAARAAVRVAHKVIVRGLARINPRIPVLSRAGDPVEHAERKAWNHLWLIDPLDGERAYLNGTGAFSVNIALIEDGQPIYGVVHAPATGTTYYVSAGKGAYRRDRGSSEPVPLVPIERARRPGVGVESAQGAGTSAGPWETSSSHALTMCALAEATNPLQSALPPSMEWQTAAAQAILSARGLHVCERESGRELRYNKKNLSNGPIRVR